MPSAHQESDSSDGERREFAGSGWWHGLGTARAHHQRTPPNLATPRRPHVSFRLIFVQTLALAGCRARGAGPGVHDADCHRGCLRLNIATPRPRPRPGETARRLPRRGALVAPPAILRAAPCLHADSECGPSAVCHTGTVFDVRERRPRWLRAAQHRLRAIRSSRRPTPTETRNLAACSRGGCPQPATDTWAGFICTPSGRRRLCSAPRRGHRRPGNAGPPQGRLGAQHGRRRPPPKSPRSPRCRPTRPARRRQAHGLMPAEGDDLRLEPATAPWTDLRLQPA